MHKEDIINNAEFIARTLKGKDIDDVIDILTKKAVIAAKDYRKDDIYITALTKWCYIRDHIDIAKFKYSLITSSTCSFCCNYINYKSGYSCTLCPLKTPINEYEDNDDKIDCCREYMCLK